MLGIIIGDIKNTKQSQFPKKCLSYSILTTLTIATMSSLICPINRKEVYKAYINGDKLHNLPLLKWSMFDKDIKNPKINDDTLLRVCPLVMKYSNYNILFHEMNLMMDIFNVSKSNVDLCNTLTKLLYTIKTHNSLDKIKSYIRSKHCKTSLELTYYKTFNVFFESNTYEECIEMGNKLSNDKTLFHKEIVLPTIHMLAELYYDTIPVREYDLINKALPNKYKILIKNFYCKYASSYFITSDIITHLITY